MVTLVIDYILEEGAIKPTKAYVHDAGFDLYSRDTVEISPRSHFEFDTGVRMYIPEGYVGFLKSKSGLNVKHSITSEGVIDAGYTGTIVVKLYNHSDVPYIVNKGDKISQLVILPLPVVLLNNVDEFYGVSDRGDKGFGSSGK